MVHCKRSLLHCMFCIQEFIDTGQLFVDVKEDIIVDFLRRMMSKHCNVEKMLISDYFRVRCLMLNDAG